MCFAHVCEYTANPAYVSGPASQAPNQLGHLPPFYISKLKAEEALIGNAAVVNLMITSWWVFRTRFAQLLTDLHAWGLCTYVYVTQAWAMQIPRRFCFSFGLTQRCSGPKLYLQQGACLSVGNSAETSLIRVIPVDESYSLEGRSSRLAVLSSMEFTKELSWSSSFFTGMSGSCAPRKRKTFSIYINLAEYWIGRTVLSQCSSTKLKDK